MKRFISILLSTLLIICFFTSCKKQDEEPVVEEKVWVIGTVDNLEPFEYYSINGKLIGIDIDILDAISKDQGFTYELTIGNWNDIKDKTRLGKCDAFMASVSITDERVNDGWIFSNGYYTITQAVAVTPDSPIESFYDLRDKEVAALSGTLCADYLYSVRDEYGLYVYEVDNYIDAFQALMEGTCDAIYADMPTLESQIANGSYDIKILYDTGTEGKEYGLAIFDDSNMELVTMFNNGLNNIKMSGEYYKIIQKYLGDSYSLKNQ